MLLVNLLSLPILTLENLINMEDTISLQVKLRGGEAMYVTPVSFDWSMEANKFHIYNTLEFLPRISFCLQHFAYRHKYHSLQLWCFRFNKLIRAAKVPVDIFFDNIRNFTGANVFDSWFPNRTWEWWDKYLVGKALNHNWFYAVDIFPETLHIEGNIEVDWSNVDRYISWGDDSYVGYLPPSSLWIEERLKENFNWWGHEDQLKEVEEKFWKWRQEQVDKGYEVYYITSLET